MCFGIKRDKNSPRLVPWLLTHWEVSDLNWGWGYPSHGFCHFESEVYRNTTIPWYIRYNIMVEGHGILWVWMSKWAEGKPDHTFHQNEWTSKPLTPLCDSDSWDHPRWNLWGWRSLPAGEVGTKGQLERIDLMDLEDPSTLEGDIWQIYTILP